MLERFHSRSLRIRKTDCSDECPPKDEMTQSGGQTDTGRVLTFLEQVLSDPWQTENLKTLVLTVAFGAAVVIVACAVPVLAFGISGAVGIGALCGSLVSIAAIVATIARIVKRFRRRR
jgi:hypothetical protein